MMADVAVTRTDFQYQAGETAENFEPVIQHVWSQKPSEGNADKSEATTTVAMTGQAAEKDIQHSYSYGYDRASLIAGTQPCGTRIAAAAAASSEANKISFVHIAPKIDGRRLSYTGSLPETSSSPPSNSPEANPNGGFTESSSPTIKTDGGKEGYVQSGKDGVYVPSGKNIINDSPWPPDFEPTVKEMRRKLYEFGVRREGVDEPPREEMRKLRQYYAVKFRSWLKDGNRDMSQLLCHYYAVAKMSNRCWERAVSIMEKYRLGLLKDMTKGLPVKQSIFQFVDRGNEEYTYDIMCKVERGETSLQEAKQKYRMILDKRKAKINTAKRLSTIEALSQVDHDVKSRRMSMEYDSRAHAMNGLSPAYPPPMEQNGRGSEEYRDCTPRPMDAMPGVERYSLSPNHTVIKQEVMMDNSSGAGEPKTAMDQEIRALNGIISAKEYEVTHFKDYNVHLQKVGSEREFEIDKLKKKVRDVENERDGMEKKWLDQVQNHVKEKYLIADLQKEVLLWKGKFKNLLDRIQGLECDARRDFDYSCRRTSMGDMPSGADFVHATNVITPKISEQRAIVRVHEGDEKGRASDGADTMPPHLDAAVHVPVTCGVSVIARDRGAGPRVYRPEPTYVYGYPTQAIHSSMVQNGLPPMKIITSGITYYDARREAAAMENGVSSSSSGGVIAVERPPRDAVAVVTDEASVQLNGAIEEDKELSVVDVDGKGDERMTEEGSSGGDEDNPTKRLVIGNKAKIIVRKRSDPSRFLPKLAAHPHKRKRMR